MAANAYIEDKHRRLTVITAQPLGVASMASGQIEVMYIYYKSLDYACK